MVPFAPLLAAGNDWVVAVLTIALPAVIWVLNFAFGRLNQPAPRPPQPGRLPPQAPDKVSPEDEVQEFLRRVRQRREDVDALEVLRPREALQPPARPVERPAARPRQPRGTKASNRPPVRTPLPATKPEPRKPLGSRIGEQVARDIDTSDVTERAGQLTKLDQADEQMEARIQSTFNRKLGQLDATASATDSQGGKSADAATEETSLAAQLLAQLANPAGVRQAVLMREIFDRPTHRW
ncbi:MAG: hypothetical protein JNG90_03250 [Planctomycetaceae bacterium]|nr:hypothetical protein [Planctomycetaceae bacterium]